MNVRQLGWFLTVSLLTLSATACSGGNEPGEGGGGQGGSGGGQGGQGPGEGEFACGGEVCTIAAQYCFITPAEGNAPAAYRCMALPTECPAGNATCDCIPKVGCEINPCSGDGSTGLTQEGCP